MAVEERHQVLHHSNIVRPGDPGETHSASEV